MDTSRIRYFLTLERTGSMTKAAELHRISTPALSKAIKVLEGELHAKLIVPNGRGVQLTDEARAFAPKLREIIAGIDALTNRDQGVEKNAAREPLLRVATFEVFSSQFMEKTLALTFPDHACLLYEMIPGKMEQAVAARSVDVALTYIPIPHGDLHHIRLGKIGMGVFGLRSHFAEVAPATPFVVPTTPLEGAPNKVRGLDGWPDGAFPRRIRYQVELLSTALGLCRRGMAVAYLPKFVVSLHNEVIRPQFALEEIPAPPELPIRDEYVYLVVRKSDGENALAKKMAAAVRQFALAQTVVAAPEAIRARAHTT